MARRRQWRMLPGETRDLGVSMDSELDADASMAGETPAVSVWTRSGSAGSYTYAEATGFTIANKQVNTGSQTADNDEVIAAGRGIFFRLTASTTPGTYYIRSECDADDGTRPGRGESGSDVLVVSGPGVPS